MAIPLGHLAVMRMNQSLATAWSASMHLDVKNQFLKSGEDQATLQSGEDQATSDVM